MGTKVEEVAEVYADLATLWAQQWGAFATGVAAKVGGGSYDTTAANTDFAAGAQLVVQGWMNLSGSMLDALAIMTGDEDEPYLVESDPYPSPPPASKSTSNPPPPPIRTLTLTGPLVAALGGDQIPVAAVTFKPPQLDSSHNDFVLIVNATGHDGSTYYGQVLVGPPTNQTIAVEVTVA
jgi:hypothetical protein